MSGLGYPVKEQGSYASGATLPETFITYQIIDSPNSSHADNQPTSITWQVQITIYSKKPSIVQGADGTIKTAMLAAGFLRGSGRSLPFDKETGHYAWTTDYKHYESEV